MVSLTIKMPKTKSIKQGKSRKRIGNAGKKASPFKSISYKIVME